jgi:hypothetical protein
VPLVGLRHGDGWRGAVDSFDPDSGARKRNPDLCGLVREIQEDEQALGTMSAIGRCVAPVGYHARAEVRPIEEVVEVTTAAQRAMAST